MVNKIVSKFSKTKLKAWKELDSLQSEYDKIDALMEEAIDKLDKKLTKGIIYDHSMGWDLYKKEIGLK